MANRRVRTGFAVWVATLVITACAGSEQTSQFVTAQAEIGDVRDSVPATGTLLASGATEIAAPREGVIAEVHVKEGDRVKAGQVLATLHSPTRAPSRDEAEATAAASRAALHEAEVVLRNARESLASRQTLEEKGFVSAAAVRTAATEVERAEAAFARLSSESAAARARSRRTSAEGSVSDIVAPLDGIVSLATARAGQRVAPGDDRPLFHTRQDIRDLVLEILVSEADLARVSMDSRVTFSVDAYPGVTEHATLVSIGSAPIRDGRFVSYRALAKVNNFAQVMKPGMSASVQLIRADARNVLRIPIKAAYFRPKDHMPPLPPETLQDLVRKYHGDMRHVGAAASGLELRRLLEEGKRVVFVLEGGESRRREIRIGAETDEYIEVIEGLKPGDLVIVGDARDPRNSV